MWPWAMFMTGTCRTKPNQLKDHIGNTSRCPLISARGIGMLWATGLLARCAEGLEMHLLGRGLRPIAHRGTNQEPRFVCHAYFFTELLEIRATLS